MVRAPEIWVMGDNVMGDNKFQAHTLKQNIENKNQLNLNFDL
jgi:hypothetical protein